MKYIVTITEYRDYNIEVDADTPEDARQIVRDMDLSMVDPDHIEYSSFDIEEAE